MKKLSVVIVSRNEENNIGRCLDSVFIAIKGIDAEVLLVDSCSEDDTVSIARKYDVKIILLRKEWQLGCAAGYSTGFKHSTGELVFFLDADMSVHPEWLGKAVYFMDAHPDVAGVAGLGDELRNGKKVPMPSYSVTGFVSSLPGVQVFRRSALDDAGNFNPFMRGDEDHELCGRLARKGYRFFRMDSLMVTHYGYSEEVLEVLKRAKYTIGSGQCLRLGAFNGTFFYHALRLRKTIAYTSFFAVSALLVIAGIFYPVIMLVVLAVHVVLFLSMIILKKGLASAFRSYAGFWSKSFGFITGFLSGARPPESYPGNVTILWGHA